ncbi:hypothetical protein HPP92_013015 [Vanilla planifolia]|uniref:CYRIA/CYRIB Rac1 binding domain-containing protein n=1 Tax=Vanilla planifolia TaxID=51239 RepID=A0A835QU48_VANPL|nr:hypothetical protein HPP92_013015 [Vanilla planifolia]
MAIPVEEAIAALSTFSLEDEQPDVQGLAVLLSIERCATSSPIEYADVSAYRLSLTEDTKAINQLNTLIHEGKEMASVLYTYRSCVKALPQLPDSMKHNQTDLYVETYHVLDLEMNRLREIQRWQASAASKLAVDMQRFSRPERLINGPTTTHFWSMLKLLDVLVQLDHLKNAKASIPNDFSWYKRTFTQISIQWQETDSMREEMDDLQNDPVIPAFPDLHLSPVAILKELSMYFPNFSSQTRLLTLPSPHEMLLREIQEYPT